MPLIEEEYRIFMDGIYQSYRGKTPVKSPTYTVDYTNEPTGVDYTVWRLGFNCTISGRCTSVLTANYADGSKLTFTLTSGEWNDFYHTKRLTSYFVTTTGERNNSNGTVTVEDVIVFEYYNYTIPETKELIYSLTNQQFDGVDDYINTNIQLLSQNFNWVVFLDFTSDLNLNEMATLFHCMKEEDPYPGTGIDLFHPNGRITCASWSGVDIELFDTPMAGNRHRVAIRKLGNRFYYVIPGEDITEYTQYMDYRIIDNPAILGAFLSIDQEYGRFWGGTIHSCKIWSGYMSDEDFSGLMVDIPVIEILSQDKTIISNKSGYDQCIITFQSSKELTYWEARATVSGSPYGHGVGLLVESGGTIAADTNGIVYVDDEELTNGDLLYRIDIWGRDSDGNWNEV